MLINRARIVSNQLKPGLLVFSRGAVENFALHPVLHNLDQTFDLRFRVLCVNAHSDPLTPFRHSRCYHWAYNELVILTVFCKTPRGSRE